MNWNEIEGDWEKFKGQAKQQWGKLTDNDLLVVRGRKQELMGTLQNKYGYTVEQAEKELDKFASNCKCNDSKDGSKNATFDN